MSGREPRPGGHSRRPDRAADLRTLEVLHVIETEGTTAARERFRMTNSAVQGMRSRMLNPKYQPGCLCEKPENKGGGMPEFWWRS